MKNILIIRRDNIGDLVCTTPLIEGVKTAYPDANLYLLINKVSQDVVKNNPHLTKVFVYKKAKHKAKNETTLGVYFERLMIFLQLRKIKFDAAILANPVPCKYSLRLAKMAGVKNIIGADLVPVKFITLSARRIFTASIRWNTRSATCLPSPIAPLPFLR